MKKFLSKLFIGNIVYKKTTNKSFEKTLEALKKSIEKNNFKIITIHNLKETFQKKNLALPKDFEYQIVQLCNAKKAHNAITNLSYDMGIMMPKSIIIAREKNQTSLRFMQMKPWMVAMMFPEIAIAPLSKKVMGTLKKIIDETI